MISRAVSASTKVTVSTDFKTTEGLRALLIRLHRIGPCAWRHDPAAAELMEFAAGKYKPLALKYHLDPWEVASAAFEVMLSRAAREAIDPWAVVTHAVRITCMSEQRAQGLLCSVQEARRQLKSSLHDVERFSQRLTPLREHPSPFRLQRLTHPVGEVDEASSPACIPVDSALRQATALLVLLGWPADTSHTGVELVCAGLVSAGNRKSAYEALRRDKQARALVDLEHHQWVVLLRTLLGDPRPGYGATKCGRGVLLRMLIGETMPSLLSDTGLVQSLALAKAQHGQKDDTGHGRLDGDAG